MSERQGVNYLYKSSGTLMRCLQQPEAGHVVPKGLDFDYVLAPARSAPMGPPASAGGAHHERYLWLE